MQLHACSTEVLMSNIQKDADRVIRELKANKHQVTSMIPIHGNAIRLDTYGNKNHWRFDDKYILETDISNPIDDDPS